MASTNQTLPTAFRQSYKDRESFPCNLILSSLNTYPSALKAFKDRLDSAATRLFECDEDNLEVKFRDLDPSKRATYGTVVCDVSKRNLFTPNDVSDWLGIRVDPYGTLTTDKTDPKSRFIYIYGETSRSPLKLNHEMLAQILTFHQVMPDYLDFMAVFGLQSSQLDLRYSSFRQQSTMRKRFKSEAIPSLGRSGRQYQMCYNLKGMTLRNQDPNDSHLNEWSPRQAAFYHRFDIVNGNALWIVTKGGTDIQQRYKELTDAESRPEDRAFNNERECFASSLSVHLLFCHWSTEDWRAYLRWLEEIIEINSKMVVLGSRGRHDQTYTARDVQRMQGWDEMASEAIAALEGNMEVIGSLRLFYQNLKDNVDFDLRQLCAEDIDMFYNQLSSIMDDFRMQIARATVMVKITKDRKELVMQYLGAQSAERMEELSWNMKHEAIVVKIITIVTLIYLPATFVSTFFSTDIIKYQGTDNLKGSFSDTAMYRWLQVTLPLTFLTLLSAYWGQKLAERDDLAADKRRTETTENESDDKDSSNAAEKRERGSSTTPFPTTASPLTRAASDHQENAASIPSPQSTLVIAQNERPNASAAGQVEPLEKSKPRLLSRWYGNRSFLLPLHRESTTTDKSGGNEAVWRDQGLTKLS